MVGRHLEWSILSIYYLLAPKSLFFPFCNSGAEFYAPLSTDSCPSVQHYQGRDAGGRRGFSAWPTMFSFVKLLQSEWFFFQQGLAASSMWPLSTAVPQHLLSRRYHSRGSKVVHLSHHLRDWLLSTLSPDLQEFPKGGPLSSTFLWTVDGPGISL